MAKSEGKSEVESEEKKTPHGMGGSADKREPMTEERPTQGRIQGGENTTDLTMV